MGLTQDKIANEIVEEAKKEVEEAKKEKDLKKLKEKGFIKYTFDCTRYKDLEGTVKGKMKEDKVNLIPHNCKNLVGHNGNTEFYAQTNKGKDMATKLILREMRATDKQLRITRKDIKENVAKLKKQLSSKK